MSEKKGSENKPLVGNDTKGLQPATTSVPMPQVKPPKAPSKPKK